MNDNIKNISPIDGRYKSKTSDLNEYFSEYALIKYRTYVEIKWLIFMILNNIINIQNKDKLIKKLEAITKNFNIKDAQKIKKIESIANHDVKSVEYWLREKLKKEKEIIPFIHFACTSEDINNLSYAIALKKYIFSSHKKSTNLLVEKLCNMSIKYADVEMMSKTHGQPASPTTMGKEISVFTYRLNRTLNQIYNIDFLGKFNGAVGNFNAHNFSFPELDWLFLSKKFINSLDLKENMYTTQIESHDFLSEIFDASKRFNNIMLGLCKDFWGYISCNYFLQKVKKSEVGSSTMPHKINPIDFENAEGNLGISNSIFNHLSEKLAISRFQRDLSDSTAMRNIGVAFAHQKIAIDSLIKGLDKLEINKKILSDELKNQWDLLAEPIQNIMKLNSIDNAYEKLKSLTRNNKKISKNDLTSFVKKLKISPKYKKLLLNANPTNYTGIAEKLARNIRKVIDNE